MNTRLETDLSSMANSISIKIPPTLCCQKNKAIGVCFSSLKNSGKPASTKLTSVNFTRFLKYFKFYDDLVENTK